MGKKVSSYKDAKGNRGIHFHCPGCGYAHGVFIEGSGVPMWTFNGNEEKPTFSPSVLVQGHLGRDKEGNDIYGVCHSFVTDGEIRFLNDCTHELKGQTVELPDF